MKSNKINLKKSTYQAAKVSVMKGDLFGEEKISSLSNLTYEEILKFMEENGFKDSIDSTYLEFEGFYLIEKILNTHMSKIYSRIFNSASIQNKKLLDLFYQKYQIHNLLVVLRCKKSNEKDISPYLLGDQRKQEKFFKAFEMPIKDSLIYMLKKINIDYVKGIEIFENGDIFELENFLYSQYYQKLISTNFHYNKKDEKKFFIFNRKYIDLINYRTLIKLKIENNPELKFENLFIPGGNFTLKTYTSFDELDIEESLKKLSALEKDTQFNSPNSLDKSINELKNKSKNLFSRVTFGSPFYVLKFLFEAENEMSRLRTLLKAKYLKLSKEDIDNIIN